MGEPDEGRAVRWHNAVRTYVRSAMSIEVDEQGAAFDVAALLLNHAFHLLAGGLCSGFDPSDKAWTSCLYDMLFRDGHGLDRYERSCLRDLKAARDKITHQRVLSAVPQEMPRGMPTEDELWPNQPPEMKEPDVARWLWLAVACSARAGIVFPEGFFAHPTHRVHVLEAATQSSDTTEAFLEPRQRMNAPGWENSVVLTACDLKREEEELEQAWPREPDGHVLYPLGFAKPVQHVATRVKFPWQRLHAYWDTPWSGNGTRE